jgi:hypothetical protein
MCHDESPARNPPRFNGMPSLVRRKIVDHDDILGSGPDIVQRRLGTCLRSLSHQQCTALAGYNLPYTVSIFRNLAWRLLILEMWSSAYRVAPDVR